MILNAQPDMQVVATAGDGREAIVQAERMAPDVVIMDISMPGLNGLAATEQLTERCPAAKVLTLTRHADNSYLQQLLRAGAAGYVLNQSRPAELLHAIRLVADGGALLSPSVTRKVIKEFAAGATRPVKPHPRLDTLTDREREIVALVGGGLNNHEIAERLVVSPATARTHVSRAMVKLGARDRAQLVVFAYQSGLTS